MDRVPRLLGWLVQVCIFVCSGIAAFLLRFDFWVPPMYVQYFVWALPIWLLVKVVVFPSAACIACGGASSRFTIYFESGQPTFSAPPQVRS